MDPSKLTTDQFDSILSGFSAWLLMASEIDDVAWWRVDGWHVLNRGGPRAQDASPMTIHRCTLCGAEFPSAFEGERSMLRHGAWHIEKMPEEKVEAVLATLGMRGVTIFPTRRECMDAVETVFTVEEIATHALKPLTAQSEPRKGEAWQERTAATNELRATAISGTKRWRDMDY